jgi:hypothetical protein
LLDDLCAIQCTESEIAGIMHISVDTLAAAILRDTGLNFSEYFEQKRAIGKASLRRKQFKAAIDEGNVTMLVWLGKQWLGQTDKSQVDMGGVEEIHVKWEDVEDAEDEKDDIDEN